MTEQKTSPAQWPEDVVERVWVAFVKAQHHDPDETVIGNDGVAYKAWEPYRDILRAALATLPPPEPIYDFMGAYMGDPECFKELDHEGQLYLAKAIAANIGYVITKEGDEVWQKLGNSESSAIGSLRARSVRYGAITIEAEYPCINGLSAWFSLATVHAADDSEILMTDGRRPKARAVAKALIGHTLPPPEDATKDQIVAAWIDGATAVHNAWIDGNGEREADFTEAAHDYADSLPASPEDERVKGLVSALNEAREQFLYYAKNHRNKTPPDHDKAAINEEMAARMEAALASYRGGA